MKILRVGDPHAKVGSLDEMRALILFVVQQAQIHNVQRIEILGDLFHNHNVIRLEIIEFWNWALDLLPKICETVVLVGNHDQSGDYASTFSALSVFALMKRENLIIIEKPTRLGVFGYVPYIHDVSVFIDSARVLAESGARVLVCHQTIEGSKYESGIYAPDGIPSGEWSQRFEHVISGHIHSEQSFGNVIYPGTARWDTVTDANRRKGIWIYDHDFRGRTGENDGGRSNDDLRSNPGAILGAEFISTEHVCSPIRCFEWREGEPKPVWEPNARVAVELIGSSVWIAAEKERLKGTCSIKTKITDKQKGINRQSGKNFQEFIMDFFPTKIDKVRLLQYAKEKGIV